MKSSYRWYVEALSMGFTAPTSVSDGVDTILTFNEQYQGIIVDTATCRYDFGRSAVVTAYVLPVLGVNLSGAINQQFSFQPNDFNVAAQPDSNFLVPK